MQMTPSCPEVKVKLYFTVSVTGGTKPYEKLFVVGNSIELGTWQPSEALQLEPCHENNELWKGTITTDLKTVKFRYFIGYYLESGNDTTTEPILIISQWETFLKPRNVMPHVESMKSGICRENVNDEFGFHAGRSKISHGWIHHPDQNEILLRIGGSPIKYFKAPKVLDETFRIKIIPMDVRNKDNYGGSDDEGDDSGTNDSGIVQNTLPSFSETDVAPLSKEIPYYKKQHEFGEEFRKNTDYFIFRTTSVSVYNLGFCIEIYVTKPSKEAGGKVEYFKKCTAYAFPSSLADTCGKTDIPLIGRNGIPCGQIQIDYLFVRPLRKAINTPLLMEETFIKHWKKRSTVEVGHRGMGDSYTKLTAARENTIHSLNYAADKGADYVEFDVQLTKDKHAVVFHDFHVLVSVAKKPSTTTPSLKPADSQTSISSNDSHKSSNDSQVSSPSENGGTDMYELAVKDLTLKQLKLLHLDHVKHKTIDWDKSKRVTSDPDECESKHSFPTLVEALKTVDTKVGFNIEVKYPIIQIDGVHECSNYFERNDFVDIILADVLNLAGERRIVFSSFDPDTCLMISLKQNKYPVLFLSVGNDTKYMVYRDERTHSSINAVNFIAGTALLGVNFHSEDVLKDPKCIERAKSFGLVTFVWGDELNDRKQVEYFKKVLMVDGIIYDRIGEDESRKNIFTVEKEIKKTLFERIPDKGGMPSIRKKEKSPQLQKFSSVCLNDPVYDVDEYKSHRKTRAWSPETTPRHYSGRNSESIFTIGGSKAAAFGNKEV
uniref:Glycerophosphocholine phosphodiesterase GPCPD1 n=1 Tax=Rhabditophanes sp. KR3021 TaxID=114890 RepID=A0AC35TJX0_9BILA